MRFVSPLLKRVVYPSLASTGYLRRRAHGGRLCVVTYHGILPAGYQVTDPEQDGGLVAAENFRRQLRLLKAHYHVVSPEEVQHWSAEGGQLSLRSVLLTCDDGLLNTLTEMAPILQEEDLSCLFFVLGASADKNSQTLWYEDLYLLLLAAPAGSYPFDSLGMSVELRDRAQRRRAWWNLLMRLSQYDQPARAIFIETLRVRFGLSGEWNAEHGRSDAQRRRFSLLSAHELRQLADLGMSVGSHTLSHPVLSQQSPELAWKEISESRSLLESVVGRPVWALAYPYGDAASVTAREQEMAERAGFQCAFMNVGGGFGAPLPRFALPRVHVTAEMSLPEFEAHVSGFYRALQSRASRHS
jgi:peptidoglycan/xylan/chitin deacetylase (PgdA/CDA1 family)